MAQVFPRWTLRLPFYLGLGAPAAAVLGTAFVWYYFSPRHTDVGYRPRQPVPYSHQLHAGKLGLDCRYCHVSVEVSAVSTVPPTQVCMNCHHVVKRESEALAPVRASFASGAPLRWVRVHNLPDYAYFDHRAHVRAAIGCVSCHGRVDQMVVVRQVEPLSMRWCLDCHREPGPRLRPRSAVTDMEWRPGREHDTFVSSALQSGHVAPPVDCSGCHR